MDGKQIVSITVPKAPPEVWPVYLDNNPYRGTYYRSGDGDYRLTREEVEFMMQR